MSCFDNSLELMKSQINCLKQQINYIQPANTGYFAYRNVMLQLTQ